MNHRPSPDDRTGPADLLRVTDLTVRFGSIRVLDGVNLTVRPGELVAVAGENGAGKSTLVRCIVGDLAPTRGDVRIGGRRAAAGRKVLRHAGVGVVWQTAQQCDNLDVASNLMLGRERRWVMHSESRLHALAAERLAALGIPVTDTGRPMHTLPRAERQLIAIARAVHDAPALLVLDEPTGSLGVHESSLVEDLISRLHAAGSTIVLVSHDIPQVLRLADRIVVLRRGSIVGEVDATGAHADDIAALVAGQHVESSARRQLVRLQGLADRLASIDASSGVPLILTALAAALGVERLCLHLVDDGALILSGMLGLSRDEADALARLPYGPGGGPAGEAAGTGHPVVDLDGDLRRRGGWSVPPDGSRPRACAAVPVVGSAETLGVITVFHSDPGVPRDDEMDLIGLYAGYVAGAVERDRLLGQITARNKVLETIRLALQALTGPASLEEGLAAALTALREGLDARLVAILGEHGDGLVSRMAVDAAGPPTPGDRGAEAVPRGLLEAVAARVLAAPGRRPHDQVVAGPQWRCVTFTAPRGRWVLVAQWPPDQHIPDDGGLLADAAQCLRLAFERQEADIARQEASALRRSQDLQRQFLSRLSHELRTPLTAIRGYASSLAQPDVEWDSASTGRFVARISDESDRLGRLVGDLLDFSAIESGLLRLNPDWCDLELVLQAARGCLPAEAAGRVDIVCDGSVPALWADHDRLEQVFVNLMDNAIRHNPPGTSVRVTVTPRSGSIEVAVADDGVGLPAGGDTLTTPPGHRRATSGSGLGLSIAHGIIEAHGGTMMAAPVTTGTTIVIRLWESPVITADGEEPE